MTDPALSSQSWVQEAIPGAPLPPTLYHYTDSAGLLGILDSGKLWGTDLGYLNDSSELDYGLTIALNEYHDWVYRRFSNRESQDAAEIMDWIATQIGLREFKELFPALVGRMRHNTFIGVSCFCVKGDLLGQWRGYGGSGGYSLGFDSAKLRARVGEKNLPLRKILYNRPDQEELLHRLVVDDLDSYNLTRFEDFLHHVEISGAWAHIIGVAAQIKDEAFKDEQEWRIGHIEIVKPGNAEICFRQSAKGIIPFLLFDLKDDDGQLPLTEVIVGPGGDYTQRTRAVRAKLLTLGYDTSKVVVQSSTAPFRD